MGAHRRFARLGLWLALVLLFSPGPAAAGAWVETTVAQHVTRLSLELADDRTSDGVVVVRHQLTLKVRGGPIQHLDVPGMPTGIEILPDAALRRAESGQPLLYPLEVQSTDEGTLRLVIQSERGIRGGTYVFDFGFRGSLRELLRPEAVDGMTGLTYVGPRLSSGVDAARLVVDLPTSPVVPRLWTTSDGPSVSLLEEPGGALTGRSEIALVRPHVAVLEPAAWKFLVDPELVPLDRERPAPLAKRVSAEVLEHVLVRRGFDLREVLLTFGVAIVFGLLVALKTRAFRRACRAQGLESRALVPLPPWARGVVAAATVGLGTYSTLSHRAGWTVAGALGFLVTATELWPARPVIARGPGRWRRSDGEEPLPTGRESRPKVLEFFEVRTARGAILLSALLALTTLLGLRILAGSPYWSLLVWVGFALVLPLFFTGRLSELPKPPLEVALLWKKFLLRRTRGLEFDVWLRVPIGDCATGEIEADEARLRVRPPDAPRGLRTLEVGFEEGLGAWVKPCIVVRIVAGSDAESRLGSLPWSRGREMEEKVAILRPASARPAETARLLQSILVRMSASGSSPSDRRASTKSSGRAASARQMKLERPVPVV